jgi:hypothetical protein
VQLPPFPLWLLLAYDAIVVGGWLWNAAFAEGWLGGATALFAIAATPEGFGMWQHASAIYAVHAWKVALKKRFDERLGFLHMAFQADRF